MKPEKIAYEARGCMHTLIALRQPTAANTFMPALCPRPPHHSTGALYCQAAPTCSAAKLSMSEASAMILAVGLPAPWPARTSTRVSSGLVCAEPGAPAGSGASKRAGAQCLGGLAVSGGAGRQGACSSVSHPPARAAASLSACASGEALPGRRGRLL